MVAAAGEMLEREGPESISFRAVARAAGVSPTAPYNHFPSKEDLLATLAGAGFRELENCQVATVAATQSGQERIVSLGLAYLRFAETHPQLYRLMFGAGVADWCAHPEVAEAKRASFRAIRDALAEQLSGVGDPAEEAVDTAAIAAWALAHGLSMLLIDGSLGAAKDDPSHGKSLIMRILTQFAAGLTPKPSTR
ncbi:TetR/AcrR family transcriptional regulator [Mesorhizobium escarrei]|uniref:TetR/AcrR family transcriptional regulator n=1 Tax=Mesorhizobium escarrei TaxID=666018 RepID=UPI0020A76572|nr:TetR/AcrR family transcriptional regulator [Mesorhizobium escarrei]